MAFVTRQTPMADPLLSIRDLTVQFPDHTALHAVDLDIPTGQTVALVGESGSGKTLTARSILRVLPKEARITAGQIQFDGLDLTALSLKDKRLAQIRGGKIGMIYQEPMTAMSEFYTIGDQIEETLIQHGTARKAARSQAIEMLRAVDIPEPEQRINAFSFELSGGQRQRAMIAMALATEPRLLIADEPTTALDVTTQAVVLKLLKRLQREQRMAMLFVTHDMSVVANVADEVVVLYRGEVVERGSVRQVLRDPQHDYTQTLIAAVPNGRPGQFRKAERRAVKAKPVLRTRNLSQHFQQNRGLFKPPHIIRAMTGVSLELCAGETLAIVGESGSGKTTLARAILGLTEPTEGDVLLDYRDGQSLTDMPERGRRSVWRDLRFVFQDPMSSLNARMSVFDIIADPLRRAGHADPAPRVYELLERVGMNPEHANRYPHAFSGGQRQRISIARALAPAPRILVLDEAVSALDVSVQARVLRLLADLQDELGLTYLFITHDLDIVTSISDRVAVMQRGQIVETGLTAEVFEAPQHPYTQALLNARLPLDPDALTKTDRTRVL